MASQRSASLWLKRQFARIYTTQVKEHIPCGFGSHALALRVMGLWPTANDSSQYKWLTVAYFVIVSIYLPFSMFVNIFYANSIKEAMNHLFITLSGWAIAIRTAALYWRQDSMRDIFRIHAGLVRCAESEHAARNERIACINSRLHMTITALYYAVLCAVFAQIAFLEPEHRILSSTSLLPYDLAQRRTVYLTMLMFQMFSAFFKVLSVATLDSVFVALINAVCGHVRQLKERLRHLGANGDDFTFYQQLVDCSKRYEDCLR